MSLQPSQSIPPLYLPPPPPQTQDQVLYWCVAGHWTVTLAPECNLCVTHAGAGPPPTVLGRRDITDLEADATVKATKRERSRAKKSVVAEESVDDESGAGKSPSLSTRLLAKDKVEALAAWFMSHLHHPYPSKEEAQALMDSTSLSAQQITNWYANARRRNKNMLGLTERTAAILVDWFAEHRDQPYLTRQDCDQLVGITALQPVQIQRWVTQARSFVRSNFMNSKAASVSSPPTGQQTPSIAIVPPTHIESENVDSVQ